jgi:flagellar export protein FliJ
MAFQFSLQSVLHLRQSLEHQQELRLRAANQLVSQMQDGIERVEMGRRQWRDRQAQELSAGMTAAELRFALERDSDLLAYKTELEKKLAQLQQLRDHQLEIFQQARQARKTLETVRNRQQRAYQRETLRLEQKNLDDLFLLRKEYLRRG